MIYLFYGDNTHAAKAQVRQLVERFRKSTGGDYGLHRFSDESEPEAIVNAMTSADMFSGNSLVIVEHPSRSQPLKESLLKNIDRVPKETVVVLLDPEVDKRTTWFKTLNEKATVKEFVPKAPVQLAAWAAKEAGRLGFDLGRAEAQFLSERVGQDQWRLSQELKKLSSVDKKITKQVIEELVEPTLEQSIFDLLDALAAGRTEQAVDYYRTLRAQNVHYLEILTMLGWQLRNLLVIKSAGSRSDGEIAKDHGINPYVIRKSRGAVGRAKLNELAQSYQAVITADYRLKTGAVNSDATLEDVIMTIGRRLR